MLAPLFAYALTLGLAVAIPGPGVAALVGQAMGNGLRAALCLLGGMLLGDFVYLTIAVAGLATIAQTFAGVFVVVKLLGGAYLLYLARKLWRSKGGAAVTGAARGQSDTGAFLAGFSVTLSNPKTIVFYLALLPTVLDLRSVGVAQWAILVPVTALVLVSILVPYAVLASRARGLMERPGALERLNRLAGGIIGGTGMLILGQAAVAVARRA